MSLLIKKLICLSLISSLMFIACAAHTPKVIKPTSTAEKSGWLDYYKDQFKAFGKEVSPPAEDATDTQKLAYKEARTSWKTAQKTSMMVGIGALLLGIVTLGGTLSQL